MAPDSHARQQQAFRDLAVERIELIQSALADLKGGKAGAGDTLRRVTHTLRASATSHGNTAIASAAAAVEDAGDADVGARAETLLAALRSLVAAIPAESKTVLVVDDDEVMTTLISATLESPDRTVIVAPTWRDAKAQLSKIEPVLIVLDLVLPDTDGRNAIIQIRESETTARTPIVVVSGVLGDAPHAECLALGANGYVVKPFHPKHLAAAVDDALRAAASIAPAATRASAVSGAIRAPAPVLLAEDDPVVATLVVERLKRAGLEVVHCASGTDAVEALKTRVFACAILDIKLPGVDGFAVLAAIRGNEISRGTPVAMLTGMGQEKDVTRGFELGADDYIVKPFSPRELSARVQRLIDRAGVPR